MVSFTLRESVYELEKPSHPSHHVWMEAMTLFRDMGRDDPPSQFSYGTPEDTYRCLNVPNPQEVMYLYREIPLSLKRKLGLVLTRRSQPSARLRRLRKSRQRVHRRPRS